MKTTILASRKRKLTTESFFPALYQSDTGDIVLASDMTSGVVIHSAGGRNSWELGYKFTDSGRWDETVSWKRVTEPTTIKFNP